MFLSRILLFSILYINLFDPPRESGPSFISPVKIPLALSANFGELRLDHFHSGLDIKTQGTTGKEVVAAASGFIYRISVSPGGFGKALYVRHPSGYSTVYGHLDRFTPELERYVKSQQYDRKSFMVTLFPPKDRFPVEQGQLIAYSGNSGSSGGPHLHYEIRKADSEIPVNPLFFEFGVSDRTKPVIERLVVYPLTKQSSVNGQKIKKGFTLSGSNGRYSITPGTELNASGLIGFGIKAYDQLDDSNNKCAVYSIEVKVDSSSVYRYVMDAFSFNESRYINSHIDYESYQRDRVYVERCFVLPNDRLSVCKNSVNRGLLNFNDSRSHSVVITVADIEGNRSSLSFTIKPGTMNTTGNGEQEEEGIRMPFGKSNFYENEDIKLNIPDGALYDTLYFTYKKSAGGKGMLSDLHWVNNIYTPLHKPAILSVRPGIIPDGKKSRMLLIRLAEDGTEIPMNSYWSDGYLNAEIRTFGRYFIGMDTTAPLISANGLSQGINLTGKTELRIKITDDLSGINYYEPSIDGKWALFEYDQKNDLLIYLFDPERLSQGIVHNLTLKVADNKDNISYYKCSFKW